MLLLRHGICMALQHSHEGSCSVWSVPGRPCHAVAAPATPDHVMLSSLLRSRLGPMSTVGVAIAGCFATSVVAVTGIAIWKGQLGGGWADSAVCCGIPHTA